MEGLLQAHDSIASLTDRAYCSPSNMNTMQAKVPLHNTMSNMSNNLKHEQMKGYSSSNEDIKKVKHIENFFIKKIKTTF
jgi:hypothetical protein